MKTKDLWHYARRDLAQQIVALFESGLSSSLVFFAPRRMGKTEFLRKDITPAAEAAGWRVIYFSFLDAGKNPASKFKQALTERLTQKSLTRKAKLAFKKVASVSAGISKVQAGVEFNHTEQKNESDIKKLIEELAQGQKTLLLMDEIQILALSKHHDEFVASLRTALDINKDRVKVIFTGSSQAGLRKMFSEAKAPFFHFGQNLDFPELGHDFTDHLAQVFKTVTGRVLEQEALFSAFVEMNRVPLLVRSLVERLALNPNLSIAEAKTHVVSELFENTQFEERWIHLSALEQALLREIATGRHSFFSQAERVKYGALFNLPSLSAPVVQAALNKLLRKGLIGRGEGRSSYFLDDPSFQQWISEHGGLRLH